MSQSLSQEIDNINYAVRIFAEKMREKMKVKARQGYKGWDDKELQEVIITKLKAHTEKLCNGDFSQAVDVANLAMMLDYQSKEKV